MRVDFIHVGYHRTASTWLQKRILPQVPGLLICNDARYDLERVLFDTFILSDPFRFDREVFLSGFTAAVREKAGDPARFRLHGISEENLSGDVVNGKDARMLADRLRDVFGDTRILIVIRNQIDMMLSIYSNYVVHGGIETLPAVLRDLNLEGMRVVNKLKFSGLIDHYRGLFGAENVHVECFEQLIRETVPLRSFFAGLGVELKALQLPHSDNRGRSLAGNSLVRAANRVGFGARNLAKLPLPDRRAQDRAYVHAVMPDAVAAWRKDNARLAGTLGHDLPPAYALTTP